MDRYGYSQQEWTQYIKDWRAAFSERWSREDREYYEAHCSGYDEQSVRASVEFFKRRRAASGDAV